MYKPLKWKRSSPLRYASWSASTLLGFIELMRNNKTGMWSVYLDGLPHPHFKSDVNVHALKLLVGTEHRRILDNHLTVTPYAIRLMVRRLLPYARDAGARDEQKLLRMIEDLTPNVSPEQ